MPCILGILSLWTTAATSWTVATWQYRYSMLQCEDTQRVIQLEERDWTLNRFARKKVSGWRGTTPIARCCEHSKLRFVAIDFALFPHRPGLNLQGRFYKSGVENPREDPMIGNIDVENFKKMDLQCLSCKRPTYLQRQHVDHDKLKDTLAFSWPTVREVTWPLRQGLYIFCYRSIPILGIPSD